MPSTSPTSTSRALPRAILALAAPAALTAGGAATAHPPRGIAQGADGTVFVAALTRVLALAPDGTARTIRRAEGAHIHVLVLAADGALWGEESAYDPSDGSYPEAIWRRAGDGRVSYRHGPTRQLERGVGLLRDRAGCSWHFGQAGPGGRALVHRKCGGARARLVFGRGEDDLGFRPALVADLAGSALDSRGRFIFRDRGVLRRVSPDGRAQVLATGLAPGNFGLALGAGETVYVAEWENRRAVAVRRGRIAPVTRSAPGWAPTGVAWRNGVLHVLEASIPRPGQPQRLRVRRHGPAGGRVLASLTV